MARHLPEAAYNEWERRTRMNYFRLHADRAPAMRIAP